ncbi:MAG: ParB/RepB/Spo0J family partition protein [Chloroflexales bacterium]
MIATQATADRVLTTLPPVPDDLPGWQWEERVIGDTLYARLAYPTEGWATHWQMPAYAEFILVGARAIVAREAAAVAEVRAEERTARTDTIRDLAPATIRRDGGTQARTGNSEEVVEEYAAAMREGRWRWHDGNRLIVFGDDAALWLADGFHRIEAAQRANLPTVPCEVRPGTRRDAVLYAVGANANHGHRRTRQDVRRAIELLLQDEEWGKWSDREISRQVGCSPSTVGTVRPSVQLGQMEGRTVSRNGTTYTQAERQPAAPAAPAPAAPLDPPLTEEEIYDLSSLGGLEYQGEADKTPAGIPLITMTDTRHPAGWVSITRTIGYWRAELDQMRNSAKQQEEAATELARQEAKRTAAPAAPAPAAPAPAIPAPCPRCGTMTGLPLHLLSNGQHGCAKCKLDLAIDMPNVCKRCKLPDPVGFYYSGKCQCCYHLSLAESWGVASPDFLFNIQEARLWAGKISDLDTRAARLAAIQTLVDATPAAPEPHPDPANAPLTDDELRDLRLLGGYEFVRETVPLRGPRYLAMIAPPDPDEVCLTDAAWRHRLGVWRRNDEERRADDAPLTPFKAQIAAAHTAVPTAPAFDANAAARQALADELHAASPRLVRLLLLALCFNDIPDEGDEDILRETLTDGLAGCDDDALAWALGADARATKEAA